MIDFKTLKKNSGQKAIEALNAEMEKSEQKSYEEDTRYWTPTRDKAGNGSAVIRFLPAPPGETLPWVKYYDHGFQGPGGWYIEKSLTTIGKDDPLAEHNSELWNSGEAGQKIVSQGADGKNGQKRRMSIVSNIQVVNDPAKPECNGKNYLYRYGAKIFDKINVMMHPDEVDEKEPVNPFDFWEGANFKLKIRKVEGQVNYDRSEFAEPGPLFENDEELEALWKRLYSLKDINDPKEFKSYDELKSRLCRVLGDTQPSKIHVIGAVEGRKEVEPKKYKEKSTPVLNESSAEEDDDIESFLAKLKEDV